MPLTEVKQFSVSRLSILDDSGNLDASLEPDLKEQDLIKIYRAMVLAREADQRMLKLQRQGRLGTFPPCTGQEAVACGAAFAMQQQDWMVGTYRELGARMMRGEPLDNTLLYYNGHEEGSRYPAELRILPTQVILGSQLPHAVGLAYGARYQGETNTAVVAFFGDGASSQGDFHEAANFAGVWQAPVVFLCQNNGWAISIPREDQTRSETIAQKAVAYGFPGVQVDGNDVLAVYQAVKEALDRARAGEGPTLIEALTYRLMMHTTADDPKKYRDPDEEQAAWARDPIPRFRGYLERKGIWNDDLQGGLEAEVKQEVEQAVARLEAPRELKPDAPFDHVFASREPYIEAQRAEFLSQLELERQEGSDA
jgi:pyruvate dehydrogenase E1 component subunit alpha